MCDPENSTERRVPFLILAYFVITYIFLIMINMNEYYLHRMNGYIIYFPYIVMFVVHLVTLLTELLYKLTESIIVIALLIESIILS
jgi:hypothetical protein